MKKWFINFKLIKLGFLALLAITVLVVLSYLYFLYLYQGKFFPGVTISGIKVSGKTPAQASQILSKDFENRVNNPLTLTYQRQNYLLNLADTSPKLNLEESLKQAYQTGRSKNPIEDLRQQTTALILGSNTVPKLSYENEGALTSQFSAINLAIKKDPVDAKLIFEKNTTITPAEDGYELNSETLLKQLEEYLLFRASAPTALPTKTLPPIFTTADAQNAQAALQKVAQNPIKLKFENAVWATIDQPTLYSLLDLYQTQPNLATAKINNQEVVVKEVAIGQISLTDNKPVIDPEKLATYLQKLSAKVDQPVKEARFAFDANSKRATEFQPAQEGRKLDIDQTALLLSQALLPSSEVSDIELPVSVVKPKVTNAEVNNFGIEELLGRGVSNFAGSIENRIYNIKLAASRINGVLVAPGETFSFNNTVGDISAATGYKQAYVIKSGRTVLDDGGGVCQVSTTLFRAVLNAGLPIIERTAHAYRVSYYEQGFPPGLDATVFYPSVDFKFKNDTSSYILIQSYSYGTTLTFNIYGTPDGRVSTLSKPVITSQTPPPPELRQDDPTLPRGTVKQVDWSAWGANVSFNRTVKRNGETLISETWKSFYKPWQAVFLVGTKDG